MHGQTFSKNPHKQGESHHHHSLLFSRSNLLSREQTVSLTIVSLQQVLVSHAGHDVTLQEHLPLHVLDGAQRAIHIAQVIVQVGCHHRVGGASPPSAVAAAVPGVVCCRLRLLWLWSPEKVYCDVGIVLCAQATKAQLKANICGQGLKRV